MKVAISFALNKTINYKVAYVIVEKQKLYFSHLYFNNDAYPPKFQNFLCYYPWYHIRNLKIKRIID